MRGTYEGDDWTNVIIPGDQFNTGIQTQVKLSVHLGPPLQSGSKVSVYLSVIICVSVSKVSVYL